MEAADRPAPLAGCRVLVVEDQYFIAEEMRRAVLASGGEVVGPVNSVAGALAAIADRVPDLAVLDVNLKGARSYPVAEALQARAVPFLFATGYDDRTLDPRFAAVEVLDKPVAPAILVAALSRLRPMTAESTP